MPKTYAQLNPDELGARRAAKLAYMASWRKLNPNRKREWDEENKEHVAKYSKDYKKSVVEITKVRMLSYRKKHRIKLKAKKIIWEKNNPDKMRAMRSRCRRKMYWSNPTFCLARRMSSRIRLALKYKSGRRTFDIIGCSKDFFIKWIQSKFLPGMSFENRDKWHVDHIFPNSCCGQSMDQVLLAQNYRNLKPEWRDTNFKKTDKLMPDSIVAAFLCGITEIHLTKPWQASDDLLGKARRIGFKIFKHYEQDVSPA